MRAFSPPAPVPADAPRPWLFLGGSIDLGEAEDWQTRVIASLGVRAGTILNPRREDWDESWVEDTQAEPFRTQVLWELEHLARADRILIYFAPESKAPVSLIEFGLHAASGRLEVVCPQSFWRAGNVRLVCERMRIPLFDTLGDWIDAYRPDGRNLSPM